MAFPARRTVSGIHPQSQNQDRRVFETKLELRPLTWLKATLTYQITGTDYSSTTDPAYDFILGQSRSPGGSIMDGRYDAQILRFRHHATRFSVVFFRNFT